MQRFQFSLKAVLVLVTVVAVFLAMTVPLMQFVIRKREEARQEAREAEIRQMAQEHAMRRAVIDGWIDSGMKGPHPYAP